MLEFNSSSYVDLYDSVMAGIFILPAEKAQGVPWAGGGGGVYRHLGAVGRPLARQ